MSEPRTEFLRYGQVIDWLTDPDGVGLTKSCVRDLIAGKVIKGVPVLPKAQRGNRRAIAAQESNGKRSAGRREGERANYYRKSQVKEALGLG